MSECIIKTTLGHCYQSVSKHTKTTWADWSSAGNNMSFIIILFISKISSHLKLTADQDENCCNFTDTNHHSHIWTSAQFSSMRSSKNHSGLFAWNLYFIFLLSLLWTVLFVTTSTSRIKKATDCTHWSWTYSLCENMKSTENTRNYCEMLHFQDVHWLFDAS